MEKEQLLNLLQQKNVQVDTIQEYFKNVKVNDDLESFKTTIN